MEHWAKKIFKKITPKHVQNTFGQFGNNFGRFWIFENVLKTFRWLDTPWNTWQYFFRKNFPKTCSKHVWTIWEQIWAFLHFWNFLIFFKNLSKTRPSMEHWAKKIFKKITPRHVQNTFGHFWERFWAFLEFWNFLDFLKTFRKLDPPCNTGQKKCFEKITPKHVQNTFGQFGNNFGRFWNFENFFRTFRWLEPPWNTGQKIFSKKLPQNMFKTGLDNLGTILGVFWILKNFKKHFEDSTLLGTLGKKNFREKYPKTCSKHVWTLLGTILGIFGFLKISRFFENISETRPSLEHWAKNFLEKITSNIVQNKFGHFWERFWAFLEFWMFLDFLKTFRKLDPPWNTGQKNFSKKLPQISFKTSLDNFGNDFGRFWNFECF